MSQILRFIFSFIGYIHEFVTFNTQSNNGENRKMCLN